MGVVYVTVYDYVTAYSQRWNADMSVCVRAWGWALVTTADALKPAGQPWHGASAEHELPDMMKLLLITGKEGDAGWVLSLGTSCGCVSGIMRKTPSESQHSISLLRMLTDCGAESLRHWYPLVQSTVPGGSLLVSRGCNKTA